MQFSRLRAVFVCLLGNMFLRSTHSSEPSLLAVHAVGPCSDFATGPKDIGLAWTLNACIEVWTQFVDSINPKYQTRWSYIDTWRDTATELRAAGTPCLAGSIATDDGVGSSTIKFLASWILAEELGCDWVRPSWGKEVVIGGQNTTTSTVMYCHSTAVKDHRAPKGHKTHLSPAELERMTSCSVVDWLEYFQFGVPSVTLPKGVKITTIKTGWEHRNNFNPQLAAIREGIETQAYVQFVFSPILASESLCSAENWDERKREITRKVLGEARHNFHDRVDTRRRFDEISDYCSYDSTRLNIAIHARMGDRRTFSPALPEYFELLESFMDTVSTEVIELGLHPPLFHVFTESLFPCPSIDTGLFDDFPSWPLDLAQVSECLDAKIPDDCPEQQVDAHHVCRPERPGVYNVVGKPFMLHVGHDVENAMTCMIEADGILMGCSTFGQLAGLLSNGISFFSMHCDGELTLAHYKIIPALAVAERGHMWVPVEGSWRDPVLASRAAFRHALDLLLENRNKS